VWKYSPWYPFDKTLGGSQSRSGCGGKKKITAPAGNRTPVSKNIFKSGVLKINGGFFAIWNTSLTLMYFNEETSL
jgi:hypothetical protein